MEAIGENLVRLLERYRYVLEELRRFEEKFGMSSEEFYRKWTSGEIAEPDDPHLLAEYLTWQDLIEELEELKQKLYEIRQKSLNLS